MSKPERSKEVDRMIANIMKARECTQAEAIEYMLAVATGRLKALKRYSDSVPEGKTSKGVMVAGKRKRAEKTPAIKAVVTEPKPAKAEKAVA